MFSSDAGPAGPLVPSRTHLSRLMQVWRSAGWPHRDPIEVDLIASGWVSVHVDEQGRETLRLTDSGFQLLAASRQRNLRANSRHDRLAQRVARQLVEAGRIAWLELSLRALVPSPPGQDAATSDTPAVQANEAPPLRNLGLWGPDSGGDRPEASDLPPDTDAEAETGTGQTAKGLWRMARPDVFSVRNTSVQAYLQPVVHEIKVSRADLLSDLRHAAKRESYRWLCSACYYVFPSGIAKPNEIPPEFGVWVLHGDIEDGQLEQLRPARHTPCQLPFSVWMTLAKSTPMRLEANTSQSLLGEPDKLDEPGVQGGH